MGRIAGRFPRVEPRRRARAFLEGLLAGLSRVNRWSIAEQVGDASPDGMQHLLARASWDQDGVAGTCGSTWSSIWEPMTGCWWSMRPGTSRRAPRRWGCSVSTPARRAAPRTARSPSTWSTPQNGITRSSTGRLYLPRSWTDDPARCAAAGVPDDTGFATKPALAQQMFAAALDAGTPCWWVAGDEVYGQRPEAAPTSSSAVSGTCSRWPRPAGSRPAPARTRPPHGCRSGPGGGSAPDPAAKGQRLYDWAWIETTDPAVAGAAGQH
jgi:SRSO17 transposase